MKILHCISNMDIGGQENFIMNIFRNINRKEFTFGFLCTMKEEGDYDKEIKNLNGVFYYLPSAYREDKWFKYFKRFRILYNWFKVNREKYDIIHVHCCHALDAFIHVCAANKANARIIIHSHNNWAVHPIIHKFFSYLLSYMNFYRFACSKEAARWMFGNNEISKGKIKIIYNSIDTNTFTFSLHDRLIMRKELNIENKKVIGHIGRFVEQKNHVFLINVFSAFHKIESNSVLILIGEGYLKEKMIWLVNELGLEDSVLFLGNRKDVPQLLCAMDYFVFPSLYEGLGIVLIEAQSSGLRCLISKEAFNKEVIIDQELVNLLSIKNDSVESWGTFIYNKMSEKPNNRIEASMLASSSHYNMNNEIKVLEKLYHQIGD